MILSCRSQKIDQVWYKALLLWMSRTLAIAFGKQLNDVQNRGIHRLGQISVNPEIAKTLEIHIS